MQVTNIWSNPYSFKQPFFTVLTISHKWVHEYTIIVLLYLYIALSHCAIARLHRHRWRGSIAPIRIRKNMSMIISCKVHWLQKPKSRRWKVTFHEILPVFGEALVQCTYWWACQESLLCLLSPESVKHSCGKQITPPFNQKPFSEIHGLKTLSMSYRRLPCCMFNLYLN